LHLILVAVITSALLKAFTCLPSPLEALDSDLLDVTHGGGGAQSLRANSMQQLSTMSQTVWQCDRVGAAQDMAGCG
jgi:hypothetical protein